MRTQREFIKVVAQHLIKVKDMGKLKAIAEAIFANLETNMSIGEIIGYIPHAINFNIDDLRMEQLPGSGAMLNKLSFYKASYARSKTLMDGLIKYLELDEKETKKYYTGKIKQTVAATAEAEKEDACEHVYTSEIIKESKCKGTYEEQIATTSHEYDFSDKCKVCGVKKEVEPHTHEFTKFIAEELPATCINNGTATYRCKLCDETINKSIAATGKHNYDSNGNCTTDGCSAKKEVSNQGNTTVPDTGTTTPPTQHTHSYTETSRTDSTCTIAGTVNKQCACGATTTESLPLKSHSYTETGRTEPTCTTNGAINKTCACGATTTETLPAKHSYVNGTCTACGAADPNSTTIPPVSSAPEIEL